MSATQPEYFESKLVCIDLHKLWTQGFFETMRELLVLALSGPAPASRFHELSSEPCTRWHRMLSTEMSKSDLQHQPVGADSRLRTPRPTDTGSTRAASRSLPQTLPVSICISWRAGSGGDGKCAH
jgi:hypothetical protein